MLLRSERRVDRLSSVPLKSPWRSPFGHSWRRATTAACTLAFTSSSHSLRAVYPPRRRLSTKSGTQDF
jgi:hypothetical protein